MVQLQSHLLSSRPVGDRRERSIPADRETTSLPGIEVCHRPPPTASSRSRPPTVSTRHLGRVSCDDLGDGWVRGSFLEVQTPVVTRDRGTPPAVGTAPTDSNFHRRSLFFSRSPSPFPPTSSPTTSSSQAPSHPVSPASRAETPIAPLPASCVDWKAFTGPWSGVSQPLNGGKIE